MSTLRYTPRWRWTVNRDTYDRALTSLAAMWTTTKPSGWNGLDFEGFIPALDSQGQPLVYVGMHHVAFVLKHLSYGLHYGASRASFLRPLSLRGH